MEEELKAGKEPKNHLRKAVFYGGLFLSGCLISIFAREGIGALRFAADIAGQTLGGAWTASSGEKVVAKIPLKGTTKAAKPVARKKVSPPVAGKSFISVPATQKGAASATPSSLSDKNSSTIPANNAPAPQSPVTAAGIEGQTNQSTQQPSPATISASGVGRLVIAEVQISGGDGDSSKDFIRIGNPGPVAVNLSGWKLRKRTSKGTESSVRVIPDGISIPAGGTIVWASSKNDFAVIMGAQIVSSANLSADNSVALFDKDGILSDAVAWGSGANQFVEGNSFSENPGDGQILKRKMQNGTWQDTGNNAIDFSV